MYHLKTHSKHSKFVVVQVRSWRTQTLITSFTLHNALVFLIVASRSLFCIVTKRSVHDGTKLNALVSQCSGCQLWYTQVDIQPHLSSESRVLLVARALLQHTNSSKFQSGFQSSVPLPVANGYLSLFLYHLYITLRRVRFHSRYFLQQYNSEVRYLWLDRTW